MGMGKGVYVGAGVYVGQGVRVGNGLFEVQAVVKNKNRTAMDLRIPRFIQASVSVASAVQRYRVNFNKRTIQP